MVSPTECVTRVELGARLLQIQQVKEGLAELVARVELVLQPQGEYHLWKQWEREDKCAGCLAFPELDKELPEPYGRSNHHSWGDNVLG